MRALDKFGQNKRTDEDQYFLSSCLSQKQSNEHIEYEEGW